MSQELEAVAEQCHKQWAGWTEHVLLKLEKDHGADTHILPKVWIERWQRQIDTPYADLSEEEKEADRREARKILAALADLAALRDIPAETLLCKSELQNALDCFSEVGEQIHKHSCPGTPPPCDVVYKYGQILARELLRRDEPGN